MFSLKICFEQLDVVITPLSATSNPVFVQYKKITSALHQLCLNWKTFPESIPVLQPLDTFVNYTFINFRQAKNNL